MPNLGFWGNLGLTDMVHGLDNEKLPKTLCVSVRVCQSINSNHAQTARFNIPIFLLLLTTTANHVITQDKAPNQFNNTPLADQRYRVLLAPLAPSIVSIAKKACQQRQRT